MAALGETDTLKDAIELLLDKHTTLEFKDVASYVRTKLLAFKVKRPGKKISLRLDIRFPQSFINAFYPSHEQEQVRWFTKRFSFKAPHHKGGSAIVAESKDAARRDILVLLKAMNCHMATAA